MASSFGPSALVTPANGVTLARVAFTPLLLVVIVASGPSYPTLAGWIVLASTDGVDGYLARRHGTTRSGAFLDPLADKLLVLGALVALTARGAFSWLPVTLIAAREVAMSGYRSWVGRRGVSVPARSSAKVKTVVQEVAVGVALFPPLAGDHAWTATSLLWVAVVLTLGTGFQYLLDGRHLQAAVTAGSPPEAEAGAC